MDLNIWYKNRQSGIKKSESINPVKSVAEINSIPQLTEFVLSKCDPLAIEYGSKIHKDPIQGMMNFLTQQSAQDKIKELTNSQTLYSCVSTAIQKSWADIISVTSKVSIVDLEKAVDSKSWQRMVSKQLPEAENWINHSSQIKQHPAPKNYVEQLNRKNNAITYEGPEGASGVSAKMLHLIPNQTKTGTEIIMAKPYHKKIESCVRNFMKHPISGWASLTTKSLFNAGNIGHLCENVSGHEHNGVPITVHKFSPNYRDWEHNNTKVEPLQVMQIGVMDFLTNNLDRHHENILVSQKSNKNNKYDLLAIDHERNFQYHKTPQQHFSWGGPYHERGSPADAPNNYIEYGRSFYIFARSKLIPKESISSLVSWWKKNSANIKTAFIKELAHIKDQTLREHINSNFIDRFNYMDDWSKNKNRHNSLRGLDVSFASVYNQRFQAANPKQIKQLIDKADLNKPHKVVDAIGAFVKQYGGSHKHDLVAEEMLSHLIEKMSPQQVVDAYKHMEAHPEYSSGPLVRNFHVKNAFMDALRESKDPTKLVEMIKHFKKAPGGKNKLWIQELNGILKRV